MVVCQVTMNSKHRKNNKLRLLASDINFKRLPTGCPIAHGLTSTRSIDDVNFIKISSLQND